MFKIIAKYLSIFFAVLFIVDIIQLHIQLFKMSLVLNDLSCYKNYFQVWQDNADTLALSFTVISLYYIFRQIELSAIQNYYPLFENWKSKHQNELNKLLPYSVIYHTIDNHLFKVFCNLMSTNRNLRISNRKELTFVLGPILTKENIAEFEEFMKLYKNSKKIPFDRDNIESHSYRIIKDFIDKVFTPSSNYHKFSDHIREMFKERL